MFNALYVLDINAMRSTLDQLVTDEAIVYAEVRGPDGNIVAAAKVDWIPKPVFLKDLAFQAFAQREPESKRLDTRYLGLSAPLAAGSEQIGTLGIVFDQEPEQAVFSRALKKLLIILFAISSSVIVVGIILTRYAVKPFAILAAVADKIGLRPARNYWAQSPYKQIQEESMDRQGGTKKGIFILFGLGLMLMLLLACTSRDDQVADAVRQINGQSVQAGVVSQVTPANNAMLESVERRAMALNAAAAMGRIFEVLKAKNIEDRDIQTSNFNINPRYTSREVARCPGALDTAVRQVAPAFEPRVEAGREIAVAPSIEISRSQGKPECFKERERVIIGYEVTNQLTVKLRDLDDAGSVIDEVTAAGGNLIRFNGINFTIDDTDALQDQARSAAIGETRASPASPSILLSGCLSPPLPRALPRQSWAESWRYRSRYKRCTPSSNSLQSMPENVIGSNPHSACDIEWGLVFASRVAVRQW